MALARTALAFLFLVPIAVADVAAPPSVAAPAPAALRAPAAVGRMSAVDALAQAAFVTAFPPAFVTASPPVLSAASAQRARAAPQTLYMKSAGGRPGPMGGRAKPALTFSVKMMKSILGLGAAWSGAGLHLDASNPMRKHFPLAMADANARAVPPKRDGRKRVLFLLSDTGGGHKASAKAIQMALDQLYPGQFLCEICDIYTDYGKGPWTTLVPFYQWAAKNPWAWRAVYYSGQNPVGECLNNLVTHAVNQDSWRSYMESFGPDIVVSVHPLCQDPFIRILKKMGGGQRKIPFVTVVTDLGGAHNHWFHKEVDKCCVPGDEIEAIALRRGLKPSQIKKHGLPVRAGFWEAAAKKKSNKAIRAQLGLDDKVTVLVAGGGDGVGGLQKVAESVGENLARIGTPSQMVVICGKNEKVAKALRERQWKGDVNVVVNGFVSNMDEWMIASDCLVTKAGPGTIAEASIVGLPTMLSGFLPGQEAGNVPYVINAGFGDFSKDPGKIGSTVASWLANEQGLATMSRKATSVGTRHAKATKEIAVEIASLLLG